MVARLRLLRTLATRSAGTDMGYVLQSPANAFADASNPASVAGSTVPPFEDLEPQEPGPEDCCQQGCHNCVWNVYRDQHRAWAERNGKVVKPPPAETMLERLERELEEKAKRQAQSGKP